MDRIKGTIDRPDYSLIELQYKERARKRKDYGFFIERGYNADTVDLFFMMLSELERDRYKKRKTRMTANVIRAHRGRRALV